MVFIDYRKLISFSKGSFIVTMPKSWVEANGLKKGDMLGVEEDSVSLIFYAREKEPEHKDKTISINVEGKNLDTIKAEIVSSYLNNYNTLEIFSRSLGGDAPTIKEIIRNLSGMEIIEQTATRIVAKDLIDIGSISIESIIRRMDIITRSMIDDSILCLQGKCSPATVLHRDVDVNRLYYLGFRVVKNAMSAPMIMKKLNTNPWKLYSDKQVMTRVEEIADRQKRVCRLLAEVELKGNALEEFRKLNEDIRDRYRNVMKAYYSNDKKIALDIEVTNKGYIELCDKLLGNVGNDICGVCQSNLVSSGSKPSAEKMAANSRYLSNKHVAVAKIVEYTKATAAFIRHIARTVLNMD